MPSYPPIKKCIYCGAFQLPVGLSRFTDEHTIPFAFGGTVVLPEASCITCMEIINKEIETPILLQDWGPVRVKRNFPSRSRRRNRSRKTTVDLKTIDGNTIRLQYQDYSCPFPIYRYSAPREISGLARTEDWWKIEIYMDMAEEIKTIKSFPEWDRTHLITLRNDIFARMLAKIAHAIAAGEYGLNGLVTYLPDIILGNDGDFAQFVGSSPNQGPIIPNSHHEISPRLHYTGQKLLYIIDLRLFPSIASPTYNIVVGEVILDNPEHISVLRKHCADGKLKDFPIEDFDFVPASSFRI